MNNDNSFTSNKVTQALLTASKEIQAELDILIKMPDTDSVEAIERSHQVRKLKKILKYLETKAITYRIDYD